MYEGAMTSEASHMHKVPVAESVMETTRSKTTAADCTYGGIGRAASTLTPVLSIFQLASPNP